MKTKKLIIFGLGDLAAIALEYFTNDSEYEVVSFTVDRGYLKEKEFCGLPVIAWDEALEKYPPHSHEIYCAMIYNNMNRDRAAKVWHAKSKGYRLASYISSKAFVSPSAKIGEHVFIFEDNTIQPFVEIGDNCILWSGNHIGHHSKIGSNIFISSHVVISGHCDIGDNCFIGVNSTIPNSLKIGKESWVMHGSIIPSDIPDHSLVRNVRGDYLPLNEEALGRALERVRK